MNYYDEIKNKLIDNEVYRRMRQLYQMFNNEKWSPLVTKLTWSHYVILMSIEDINKIEYYLNITVSLNLSKRELELKIKSNEYERLDENTKNKLITKDNIDIKEYVPNPILIKNKNNIEVINENINVYDFYYSLGI